ncbi:IniB N-terminal domain-containing protein [Amycolatopsis sp. NPDC057786]|uniref:IniB N-terminal domain-containing protein n=1 Tax=Amycolatopsis sp. NPDC057786 TaxID=3346250 RepID=UPI003672ECF9
MGSVQTLHDFTLNLLNDTAARAAFANDPQQVLADAGLGDINAADVHEVVPLVLDFVPVDTATSLTGNTAATADNLAGFGGVANSTDGECADGVQGAIDQLTALTAGLPVAVPGADALPGLPEAGLPGVPAVPGLPELGLPAVPAVPAVGDLPVDVPGLPAVPAVSDVTDVSNAAAGVTALAQNTVGSFALTDDLSRGLDAAPVGQAGDIANGAVDTATGLVPEVPAVDAVQVPAVDSVPAVGDLAGDLPRTDGGAGDAPNFLSEVGDLTSTIGHVDVADVTTKVHDVANNYGDVANNHGDVTGEVAGNVANDVANVANHAGVTEVHDTVSDVTGTIGTIGDVNIGTGDIASNNDIHIG